METKELSKEAIDFIAYWFGEQKPVDFFDIQGEQYANFAHCSMPSGTVLSLSTKDSGCKSSIYCGAEDMRKKIKVPIAICNYSI